MSARAFNPGEIRPKLPLSGISVRIAVRTPVAVP